jgi:glucoamylase
MAKCRDERAAFGWPGIEPRWTYADKDGVGTAYAISSRIWFTLLNGVLTEIYYPTVDRPQVRDFQYLITDGSTFFHDERRHLRTSTERIAPQALGYRVTNEDPDGRYAIVKEIISDPHYPCILQHTTLDGESDLLSRLRSTRSARPISPAEAGAITPTSSRSPAAPFSPPKSRAPGSRLERTCRSAAPPAATWASDGWTDLADSFQMEWQFDRATDGNVALPGELALEGRTMFTLGLALGESLHNAVTTLVQSQLSAEQHRPGPAERAVPDRPLPGERSGHHRRDAGAARGAVPGRHDRPQLRRDVRQPGSRDAVHGPDLRRLRASAGLGHLGQRRLRPCVRP